MPVQVKIVPNRIMSRLKYLCENRVEKNRVEKKRVE